MQPKYTHNKSNIIQITEEAKRKSRHRLIGSIVLLFLALILLLNVTAKVKPIAINPNVVEIKNSNASATTINTNPNLANNTQANASGIITTQTPVANITKTTASSPALNAVAQNSNTGGAKATKDNASTAFKAGVVNKNAQPLPLQGTISQASQPSHNVKVTPAIKPVKRKPAVNPEDILNGVADVDTTAPATTSTKKSTGNSYIQFAALSTQEKADELQQTLASHGLNASIKPIKTSKGTTLYRLRAGPFDNNEARQKLQKFTAEGYSGIVTGN